MKKTGGDVTCVTERWSNFNIILKLSFFQRFQDKK